ncbi:hypothetical protein AVEN_39243-1 [Araneus ventricosus]|uniref:Uncharacterized protein n=1 Tax=Araneus ventricosus TaxID=182803 RepID=A0A4Y2ESG9_ARAVE|nr:hypothetical protein AVEN_39243-1 [Araneus ventricosus]
MREKGSLVRQSRYLLHQADVKVLVGYISGMMVGRHVHIPEAPPSNLGELKVAVASARANTPPEQIGQLVQSIPRRIPAVLKGIECSTWLLLHIDVLLIFWSFGA